MNVRGAETQRRAAWQAEGRASQSELARVPAEVDVQAEDVDAVCEQDVLPARPVPLPDIPSLEEMRPERTDQKISVKAIAVRKRDSSKHVIELQEAPVQNMCHGFGSRIRGGEGAKSVSRWRLRPRRRLQDRTEAPDSPMLSEKVNQSLSGKR